MKKQYLFYCLLIIISLFYAFNETENKEKEKVKRLEAEKMAFVEQEDYEAAFSTLSKLINIHRKNENWEQLIEAFNEAYYYTDEEAEKAIISNQAVVLATKHLPNKHRAKGFAYQIRGDYFGNEYIDSATYYFKKAIDIFKQQKEWEEAVNTNLYIGMTCYEAGVSYNVEPHLLKAISLIKKHNLSSDYLQIAYNLLGAYYFSTTTDLEKAINITQKAINLSLQDSTIYDPNNMTFDYTNLGVYYENKKNIQRATHYFERALQLKRQLKAETWSELEDFGRIQYKLGHYSLGIQFLKEAIKVNEERANLKKQLQFNKRVYSRLALIYTDLDLLDSAAYFVERSLDIAQKLGIKSIGENRIKGGILLKQGQYQEAVAILENIPLNLKQTNFKQLDFFHKTYLNLGMCYTALRKHEKALTYYQKALASNCPTFQDTTNLQALPLEDAPYFPQFLVEILEQKALTLQAMNTDESLKAAFETNQLAILWAEKMRHEFAFETSKVSLNKTTKNLYQTTIELAYKLYQTTKEEQYLKTGFSVAEKRKGVLLLESLIDAKGKSHFNIPDSLLEREQYLKSNIAYYKQKLLETDRNMDTDKYEQFQTYHNQYNIAFANFKDTLSAQYKSYFENAYQTSIVTIPKIQKELLHAKKAFIEFYEVDSLYYVFLLQKGKSDFIALKKTVSLDTLYALLHTGKQVRKAAKPVFEQFTKSAYATYQMLFEPLRDYLSADVEELIIVPDGNLHYLPFESLLSKSIDNQRVDFLQLPYLLRSYQFHYGYSGTLLIENKKQRQQLPNNSQVLAFAPSYEEEKLMATRGTMEMLRGENATLQGTLKEVQAIAQYFDGTFHFDENATKSNFKKEAANYGILHLAMHGKANLENPDLAHLIFTENETEKDPLLHHYEIANMETNAQLVVLSACETGVGKTLAGEGVMSLGRGFMYAGVPSVVMSLWQMNDVATSELMPLFYKNLAAGKPKDKALHLAKLEYLDNAVGERAFPFYWAGFVGLGDTTPIETTTYSWVWWLVGGLVVLFGFYFFYYWKYR